MKKYTLSFTVELDDAEIHPDTAARWMRWYLQEAGDDHVGHIVFLGAEEHA